MENNKQQQIEIEGAMQPSMGKGIYETPSLCALGSVTELTLGVDIDPTPDAAGASGA